MSVSRWTLKARKAFSLIIRALGYSSPIMAFIMRIRELSMTAHDIYNITVSTAYCSAAMERKYKL